MTDIFKNTAIKFIILLGIVSLFADMTYEGARSIAGQYLAILGASGTIVGIVAGAGELIGYGLRIVSGYLSDRTGKYWTITIIGYAINLLAVPLLALARHWELAAALLITERIGKAIRTPPRDAMLSHATANTGRGWGFGLHEAMDQIGAILGPLIVSAVLYFRGEYQMSFALLLIPALLAISVLLTARALYPTPSDFEISPPKVEKKGFSKAFWIYVIAIALVAAAFVDFPLIAFHFKKTALAPDSWLPIFYAVAMGVDALAALVFGRLFDKFGISVLVTSVVLSMFFAPLVFFGGFWLAMLGMVLWGIGMGAQESIMKAVVANMVPSDKRSSGFGIFDAGYGICWFLGSVLIGCLYDISIPWIIVFSVGAQFIAVILLLTITKANNLNTTEGL